MAGRNVLLIAAILSNWSEKAFLDRAKPELKKTVAID
jgi:hypothetical protein